MIRKLLSMALVLSICIAPVMAGGKHYGELKMITAEIVFLFPRGTCVTDSTGITYIIDGNDLHLDIVYPSEYWGTYPLYLPGNEVNTKMLITNSGPRQVAKHTIVHEANVINPDGSIGEALIAPVVQENIEVALGETKIIDASFVLPIQGKSLNIFSLKLYHHYNADSPDASLILNQKAVFCPPEILQ